MAEYKYIEPSIHKYHNRYRVHVDGQQSYFATLRQARRFRDAVLEKRRQRRPGRDYIHLKKKPSAKHQGLPVGLYECNVKRPRIRGGWQDYRAIRCTVYFDGVCVGHVQRAYGKVRDRAEAIELVLKERDACIEGAERVTFLPARRRS